MFNNIIHNPTIWFNINIITMFILYYAFTDFLKIKNEIKQEKKFYFFYILILIIILFLYNNNIILQTIHESLSK